VPVGTLSSVAPHNHQVHPPVGLSRGDHGLGDPVMAGERRFDLAGLDP